MFLWTVVMNYRRRSVIQSSILIIQNVRRISRCCIFPDKREVSIYISASLVSLKLPAWFLSHKLQVSSIFSNVQWLNADQEGIQRRVWFDAWKMMAMASKAIRMVFLTTGVVLLSLSNKTGMQPRTAYMSYEYGSHGMLSKGCHA